MENKDLEGVQCDRSWLTPRSYIDGCIEVLTRYFTYALQLNRILHYQAIHINAQKLIRLLRGQNLEFSAQLLRSLERNIRYLTIKQKLQLQSICNKDYCFATAILAGDKIIGLN